MPEKDATQRREDEKTTETRQAYSPPVKSSVSGARQVDYCRLVGGVVVCGY